MTSPIARRRFLSLSARAAAMLGAAHAAGPLLRAPGLVPVSASAPAILSRAQWGADERLRMRADGPRFHPIRKFVIHHTATANGETDPAGRMRSIYASHLHRRSEDGTPWQDIGYNFVVDPHGRVWEGRFARDYRASEIHDGEDTFLRGVRGAHAGEWNGGTVGIALMGIFDGATPTSAAIEATADLIAWKCARHGLDPVGAEPWTNSDGLTKVLPTIVGHRDVRATRCPGQGAYNLLPHLRRAVADRLRGVPVAQATASSGPGGYHVVHGTGDVSALGQARRLDGLSARGVQTSLVGAAPVPGRDAFWVADVDGGVHGFGDAPYHGSIPALRQRGHRIGTAEVARLGALDDRGYWLLDRRGGIFAFGEAPFFGSVPGLRASGVRIGEADVVAIEPHPGGRGYWVLDVKGGVFAFGEAPFFGSVPGLRAAGVEVGLEDAVDLRAAPGGAGYWILDRRGGVFAFGEAPFFGSVPGTGFLAGSRAQRLVPTATGRGYHVLTRDGGVMAFGDAVFFGHGPHLTSVDLVPSHQV